ncbi:hypothetical protein [Vibrio methylphosphonaticus]|uniref:hypothetical protein n=1 Tax=Vibrio methylphosphonaticus TaxID=2946866 RepID=UPI00202A0094|nr:hypothetical protein [Vibrio methylphosphonaticus]MCL9777606.1 hypothetical protein [Vibrio methylphosphonaticus]
MSNQYTKRRSSRVDNCPQCGRTHFVCTEYMKDSQVYLYEEQCPICYDFWQIGLEDTLSNPAKFLAKDMS